METIQENIVKSLNSIEEQLKNVQKEAEDAKVSQKAATDKIEELAKKQLEQAQVLNEIAQKSANDAEGEKAPETIGDAVAAQKSFIDTFVNQRTNVTFNVETKAATLSTPTNTFTRDTFVAPYERQGMIQAVDMPLTIETLFPHYAISSDTIMYLREGSVTSNVTAREEGAAFSESSAVAPSFDKAVTQNLGHMITVTEELLANAQVFASYINTKMLYGLSLAVENAILNGDGSTTSIKGILQSGNFQDKGTEAKALMPSTGANLFDFALALKTVYENSNYFAPSTLVITPSDWTKLSLLKDNRNNYILGGPQSLASKTLWGMRVVTCPNPALEGKYIMIQPTLAASIWDRQAVQVAMSREYGTNFGSKLVSIRMDRTLAMTVDRPTAIYSGNFTMPE